MNSCHLAISKCRYFIMGVKILGKVCGVLLLVMCGANLLCASARRTVNIDQVEKFKQRAKFGQVLERSVYNNNIRLHDLRKILEMRGLIQPIVNDEEEIVHTTKVPRSIGRSRQKRDAKGGEKKKKEKGGIGEAIWKRISKGIENFKKHIRKTSKNLIRIIKGPTYPKPKGHGLTKGKGKAASTSNSSKTKVTSRESSSSDEDTR